MILLQLSSGQGPIECCRAVGLASKKIAQACNNHGIKIDFVDVIHAEQPGCFKSVLIKFEPDDGQARQLASAWHGDMLWVCQSPYRPKHKRKNWFFSGWIFETDDAKFDSEIKFQTCRASGAGGQHVNTTDSAVRATHTATGVSVRVESERSQHANKRLAKALLLQKLEAQKQAVEGQQDKLRWQQHSQLQRGNAKKKFKGEKFTFVT